MRKILIVLFVAIVCALSCNDRGWDEVAPDVNDTIVQPDSTLVDTLKRV